jgi:acyl-CoA reductase-like NAD-dependent aldehyde dehydrogenase
MILEALRGLAALPKLIEAVERIGDKLDDKQALERLADKRKRNRAAVDRVLESASGQRGEDDSSPTVSGGDDSGS